MTLFWITAAGMIALAILFIVPPLLRFKPVATASSDELNIAVIKQQLLELQTDLEAGELDQEQYDASHHDLEKELLADTADQTPEGEPKSGRWAIFVIPLLIPVIALPTYNLIGNPEIITRLDEPSAMQQQRTSHDQNPSAADEQQVMAGMEELIDKLAQRMENEPNNAEGWSMLGRSYLSMRRLDDAMQAYAKGLEFNPTDVDLLMGLASTLAMSNGNQFTGRPTELIEQAFQLQPDNTSVLWLKGNAHFQAGEVAQAISLWEQVMAGLEPDSEEASTVAEYLKEARAKLPPDS
ncbi:hypothetical protein MNBD_GAMMA26-2014 [hydrothermal vent metagenome]|uniref:Cytochrome c-type biogenesis protein H TPR domain-containing protein n=1 Tax=hydrothermal vent metagenome TaxID=652676 RepID=A0A3B1AM56_9ZZZZ